MEKRGSKIIGLILILLGALALPFTFWGPLFGWSWGPWRLWPLLVIGAGLLFVVPPLLARGRRGLGALFIPGLPVLATGAILLFCSTFNQWGAWAVLWPLEVLAVAAGFLLATLWMDVIWLLIPASVIGANGLLLQFCALTGLWASWAVLWTIEPLSVGLALMIISSRTHSPKLLRAGLIVCAAAGAGLLLMTTIMSSHWKVLGLLGPVVLVVIGFLLLLRGGLRRSSPGVAGEH